MKLKVDQFCALATSASWQTWLYNTDARIFNEFISKLRNSRGCTANREIMKETLDKLVAIYTESLSTFIMTNYPYMIMDNESRRTKHIGPVFEYNENVVTYPRRMIFEGDILDVKRKINSFTLDKYRHDSIIVGRIGYVEYLTREDKDIEHLIPAKNWLIAAYRMKAAK